MSVNISLWTTQPADANAPATEGVAVTGANTYYSNVLQGKECAGYSLTHFHTGTMTGTYTLWVTDKRNPNLASDADWVQDAGYAPTNPAGATGKFRTTTTDRGLKHRLKYVNSGGAGVLTGYGTKTAN